MRINRGGSSLGGGWVASTFMDHAKTVFQLSIVTTLVLYGYLLYGLFTGQSGNVPNMPPAEQQRVIENIQRFSLWLNISLVALLLTSIMMYYEEPPLGFTFLLLAAFLAYGLQFCIDYLFASDAARYTHGPASEMILHEIWLTGILIGIPGVLLICRNILIGIIEGRSGEDLTAPSFGKDAVREEVPRAIIPVLAKCWQLPFCREGIRKNCPIFHAKTKCWKQRVGCMCEENVIRLAMITGVDDKTTKTNLGAGAGFVPLGDLLAESVEEDRKTILTRPGPRGVRIPHNPHISDAAKRERCRNCVIYNEHQRHKYQLFAPLITLAIPALVYFEFDDLKQWLAGVMNGLDSLVGHLSFSHPAGGGNSDLTRNVTGSVPLETLIIVCITLVALSWALRFLEYCVYKIKI